MEPEQICRGQKELDAVVMATRQLFLGRTREPAQTCVRVCGPGWDVTGFTRSGSWVDRRGYVSSHLSAFVSAGDGVQIWEKTR